VDKKKIEHLKERRLLLKEEVRLKMLRKRITLQLNYLDKWGYDYKVYYNHEYLNWIYLNVQVRKRDGYNGIYSDFQIDVNDSTLKNGVLHHAKDLLSDLFVEQFLSVIHNELTLVVCYEGGDPEIEISMEAFLSQPLEFLARPETWIITKDKSWIIEYIWNQEVIRFIQLQNTKPLLVKKIIIQEK